MMRFHGVGHVRFYGMACAVAALALWGRPTVAHERQLVQIGTSDYLLVVGFLS